MNKVNSEEAAVYISATTTIEEQIEREDNTIADALRIENYSFAKHGEI